LRDKFNIEISNVEFQIIDKPQFIGSDIANPTLTLAYFSLKMCHSLPSINSKGRCFSYKTLKNSYMSIPHNLVDDSHIMKHLGAEEDRILGHIISVKFEDLAEAVSVPENPMPVRIYGVLYKQLAKVQAIIKAHDLQLAKYCSSMEVLYDPNESAFYYDGKFISMSEATADMKKCLTADRVYDYKGKPMGYALGGENGEVYFSGTAITLHPADKEAELEALVASVAENGPIVIGDKPLKTNKGDKDMKTTIKITTDKTFNGTVVEINGTEIKVDSLYFSAYAPGS
jgi:hypothetical protein